MNHFAKPRIFISRCIEFDHCRYNGQIISSPIVRKLKEHVDVVHHCPEEEIGLGTPRKSLRLVDKNRDNNFSLVQSETESDCTGAMQKYADELLSELVPLHGFILKNRSPSCGATGVKVYPRLGKVPAMHTRGVGIFAQKVRAQFPNLALEDEGRLTNLRIREHFFTKIFLYAQFDDLPVKMSALVNFHSHNKYLFMAYNQHFLKKAGQVVANHNKLPVAEVFEQYRYYLHHIMRRRARFTSHINVLMHLLGYFSHDISSQERQYFLQQLELYKEDKITLIGVTNIIKSWIARFNQNYLANQTYFNPYPLELVSLSDSGKGR